MGSLTPSHQPQQPQTHGPAYGRDGEPTSPSWNVDSGSPPPSAGAIQMGWLCQWCSLDRTCSHGWWW
ncbi:hypothetical protein Y1Q_0019348 [Alligator mississippiensis]|uniref:Uncharacterized protein n=1 Tax=Alligator mississippiensis TaxID=8496 RepID=A0A151MQW4_ALLMI|nr:hypothetical protein Y1Q_0019348 [Alligator mississippiensis]